MESSGVEAASGCGQMTDRVSERCCNSEGDAGLCAICLPFPSGPVTIDSHPSTFSDTPFFLLFPSFFLQITPPSSAAASACPTRWPLADLSAGATHRRSDPRTWILFPRLGFRCRSKSLKGQTVGSVKRKTGTGARSDKHRRTIEATQSLTFALFFSL